jgi:hypothetical protein
MGHERRRAGERQETGGESGDEAPAQGAPGDPQLDELAGPRSDRAPRTLIPAARKRRALLPRQLAGAEIGRGKEGEAGAAAQTGRQSMSTKVARPYLVAGRDRIAKPMSSGVCATAMARAAARRCAPPPIGRCRSQPSRPRHTRGAAPAATP